MIDIFYYETSFIHLFSPNDMPRGVESFFLSSHTSTASCSSTSNGIRLWLLLLPTNKQTSYLPPRKVHDSPYSLIACLCRTGGDNKRSTGSFLQCRWKMLERECLSWEEEPWKKALGGSLLSNTLNWVKFAIVMSLELGLHNSLRRTG